MTLEFVPALTSNSLRHPSLFGSSLRSITRRNLVAVFITILLCGSMATALWLLVLMPAVDQVFVTVSPSPPCAYLFSDLNGNHQYDPGVDQPFSDLPGAEVELTSAAGTSWGTFPLASCHIPREAQNSTLQLILVLPAGYTTTAPIREVRVSMWVEDFPTRYVDIEVAFTPTP